MTELRVIVENEKPVTQLTKKNPFFRRLVRGGLLILLTFIFIVGIFSTMELFTLYHNDRDMFEERIYSLTGLKHHESMNVESNDGELPWVEN